LIQGERPARLRLQKQPWNLEKIFKIGGSHLVMIIISIWTAITFAAYFSYAPAFVKDFFMGTAYPGGYFAVLILTFTTYMAAGVAREQICLFACPYARFQGVMYEGDTLAVNYDAKRGEGEKGRSVPKAGLKTHEERTAAGHGDCIDCGFCVQVCPTGIDIRDGLQYQCISCGLCIDACNNIMDSVGYPRGLIRYDSETNIASDHPHPPRLAWKSLKVIGYATALVLMTAVLGYNIGTRSNLEVNVQQVRQPLYVMLSDGSFRNRYVIHIVNKTESDEIYAIDVEGISPKALDMHYFRAVSVKAGKGLNMNATVNLSAEDALKVSKFNFVVTPASTKEAVKIEASFNSQRDQH
jgi:cytochrome c oxidase accessory protein FixG